MPTSWRGRARSRLALLLVLLLLIPAAVFAVTWTLDGFPTRPQPVVILCPATGAECTSGNPFPTSGGGGSGGNTIVNPVSSAYTLTSSTTAYTANQLIANSATAGSVTVPTITIPTGTGIISALKLLSNDNTTTAWGSKTIAVDLWSAAPTFTNGDRAGYAVATGSATRLETYACAMVQDGDGAWGRCSPDNGSSLLLKLASGTTVYWTLQARSGSGVTGASKTMTLVAELAQ